MVALATCGSRPWNPWSLPRCSTGTGWARCRPAERCRRGDAGLTYGSISIPSDASAWRSAAGSAWARPAELDMRLLLGLDGGLEADLALGDRIDPGVHPGAPRSARQLLYATFGDSRHGSRIGRISVIRSTNRVLARLKDLLTWEPVSGFEPLACRLQEVRPPAPCPLAAPMAQIFALMALASLGLFGGPFHEPFHDDRLRHPWYCYCA